MRLIDWENATDTRSYQSETGDDSVRYIYAECVDIQWYHKLWQLDDYKVSGVAGHVVWLWQALVTNTN